MTDLLQNLINALRDELQQYGEMLAVLDQQHEASRARGATELWSSVCSVHTQSGVIQLSRQTRQGWQRQLAQSLQLPAESSFTHLLPSVPEHYRPLLAALVQENNELLVRVRERAEQNQLLLHRAVQMLQQFLNSLSPYDGPAQCPVHSSALITGPPSETFYQAIA